VKVNVTNIQRMCFHDGPGIRTTVFFKGCNLKCPWCSNPENIKFDIEKYTCDGEEKKFGFEIDLVDLENEILKDKSFFETGGGVTFSGGEPLLQFKKIEPMLASLKDKNINMCIETALMVSEEFLDIALKYIDEFIVDIKILDSEIGKQVLNAQVDLYYKNLDKLFSSNKNVTFRLPMSEEYTLTDNNIEKVVELLKKYEPKKVELFELHSLGEKKYKVLNKEMKSFKKISSKKVKSLYDKIADLGINVEIIKI